jgi:hypothetical protein
MTAPAAAPKTFSASASPAAVGDMQRRREHRGRKHHGVRGRRGVVRPGCARGVSRHGSRAAPRLHPASIDRLPSTTIFQLQGKWDSPERGSIRYGEIHRHRRRARAKARRPLACTEGEPNATRGQSPPPPNNRFVRPAVSPAESRFHVRGPVHTRSRNPRRDARGSSRRLEGDSPSTNVVIRRLRE